MLSEIMKRKIIKYILFSCITFIILRYVPSDIIKQDDIVKLTCLLTICFSILDIIIPSTKN
jgi:hypothetical protein